jgi:hypothetical protein
MNRITPVHRYIVADIGQGLGTVDRGIYRSWSLSEFPYGDVSTMFQEYRVVAFELTYQLYTQPNNNARFPTLFIAPQAFTNTAGASPATRDEVVQFLGVKTHQFGPANLTYKVRVPAKTFIGAERILRTSPWLSIGADGVRHMAVVEWISNYNAGADSSHVIRLSTKAILQFRKTR